MKPLLVIVLCIAFWGLGYFSGLNVAETTCNYGFQTFVGNRRVITGSRTPSLTCVNGDEYRRSDAGNFSTLYVCKNAAWGAIN